MNEVPLRFGSQRHLSAMLTLPPDGQPPRLGLVLLNVGVSKVLISPEARYGLSLVPFMAAIVASYVKNRIGTSLLWLGSLTSFAVVVGTMLAH